MKDHRMCGRDRQDIACPFCHIAELEKKLDAERFLVAFLEDEFRNAGLILPYEQAAGLHIDLQPLTHCCTVRLYLRVL